MTKNLFVVLITLHASFVAISQDSSKDKKQSTEKLQHRNQIYQSKYFFSQSAFPIKGRQVYYQNSMILGNQFMIGIDPNISLGLGVIPFINDERFDMLYRFNGKVHLLTLKNKLSIAVTGSRNSSIQETSYRFYQPSLKLTFGNLKNHVTMGIGKQFFENSEEKAPMVYDCSFKFQTGPKFLFTSENHILPNMDTFVLSMGGSRLFNKFSFDFALSTFSYLSDVSHTLPITYFGVTVPLN